MKSNFVIPLVVFLSVCLGIGGSVASHGVADLEKQDSTISVIAYFCKNDTMKYVRTKTSFTVDVADTSAVDTAYCEEFMIIVRDSTADGYKMELIPVSLEAHLDTNGTMTDGVLVALKDNFNDLTAVFTTDEYGSLKHLENCKEIRNRMKGGIKIMLDSLYTSIDSLEQAMPRATFEALITLMYSTEEGTWSAYDELTTLFACHGSVFDIGKKVVDNIDKDSTISTLYVGYGAYDDYGFDDDYTIFGSTVQTLSREETLDMVGGVTNILLKDSLASNFNKLLSDSLKVGMKRTLLQDYNIFFNGWPSLVRTQKIVEVGPRKKVSTDEIEWTYRSWRQYAVKRDEYQTTSF